MMEFIKNCMSGAYNFCKGIYEHFFSLSFDDLKKLLKDSEVSQDLLFYPALKWYVAPSFIKNLIWISTIVLPLLLLGAVTATPIVILVSMMVTALIESESRIIEKEIKGIKCKNDYKKILVEEEKVIIDINDNLDQHRKKELDHDVPDLQAKELVDLEGGELVTVSRTKTQQLHLNHAFVSKKSAEAMVKIKKTIDETDRFASAIEKLNFSINASLSKRKKTLTWTFHVASIKDLQEFCKKNILNLFFFFKKIQSKGATVVLKIYQKNPLDNSNTAKASNNSKLLTDTSPTNENSMLITALNSVENNNSNLSVANTNSTLKITNDFWTLGFSLVEKTISSLQNKTRRSVTNNLLIAEKSCDSDEQSTHWSLRLMDNDPNTTLTLKTQDAVSENPDDIKLFISIAPLSQQALTINNESFQNRSLRLLGLKSEESALGIANQQALTCQPGMGMFGTNLTAAGYLEKDEDYQKAKKVLDSCETNEIWEARIEKEEEDFGDCHFKCVNSL